jgi:hypothetical protein
VSLPPAVKLLAEYDDGMGCTAGFARTLVADAEVDIPGTGLGDRRKYTCNITNLRILVPTHEEHNFLCEVLLTVLQGGVSRQEMLDISRWPNTEGISFQNIPLIISQDD